AHGAAGLYRGLNSGVVRADRRWSESRTTRGPGAGQGRAGERAAGATSMLADSTHPLGRKAGIMRPTLRLALAATVAGALTVATVAPAGAQEEPAPLGFAVDKTQAQPGILVLGKANAADVAEHCTTDVEEFQARFQDRFNGRFASGIADGELFDRFFPGGSFDPIENHDQVAYILTGFVVLGLGASPELAADALPQTFVMT